MGTTESISHNEIICQIFVNTNPPVLLLQICLFKIRFVAKFDDCSNLEISFVYYIWREFAKDKYERSRSRS